MVLKQAAAPQNRGEHGGKVVLHLKRDCPPSQRPESRAISRFSSFQNQPFGCVPGPRKPLHFNARRQHVRNKVLEISQLLRRFISDKLQTFWFILGVKLLVPKVDELFCAPPPSSSFPVYSSLPPSSGTSCQNRVHFSSEQGPMIQCSANSWLQVHRVWIGASPERS